MAANQVKRKHRGMPIATWRGRSQVRTLA